MAPGERDYVGRDPPPLWAGTRPTVPGQSPELLRYARFAGPAVCARPRSPMAALPACRRLRPCRRRRVSRPPASAALPFGVGCSPVAAARAAPRRSPLRRLLRRSPAALARRVLRRRARGSGFALPGLCGLRPWPALGSLRPSCAPGGSPWPGWPAGCLCPGGVAAGAVAGIGPAAGGQMAPLGLRSSRRRG